MRATGRLFQTVMSLLLGFGLTIGMIALPQYSFANVISQAQTSFDQGLTAYQAGQFRAAIYHWQQALSFSTTPEQTAQIWGNLAIAYYETGQYLKALEANQAALALFSDLNQIAALGQVQSNLGNVYEALGDYDRAIASYQASLKIAQETDNLIVKGIVMGNLGYLYSVEGDQAAALDTYEESLAIARAMGDRESESHRLLNIGIAYHALKNTRLAAEYYQQSLQVAREIDHRLLIIRAIGNLGMAIADEEHYDEAVKYYEEGLTILEDLHHPELTAQMLNNLAHALLAMNHLEEAESYLETAIANLTRLRSDLDDASSISVFDTQIYTYNLLTQVLVAQKRFAQALEISEAGRAQALKKIMSHHTDSSSEQWLSTEQEASTGMSIAEIRRVAQTTNTTLVEYTLVPEESFQIQGKQRGATAIIYIWIVKPNGEIIFRQQSVDSQTLQLTSLIHDARLSVGGRNRASIGVATTTATATEHTLKQLYQLLITPIQDLLPSAPDEKVVFIPQGELFLVPFPALMDADDNYLIANRTILTAPSIQVLDLSHQLRQSREPFALSDLTPEQALVVGNPVMPEVWNAKAGEKITLSDLPEAQWEADAIATQLKTQPFLGPAATESAVRQHIETAQLIHMATHGLLEYGNPQDSGISDIPGAIALAPDSRHDGLLTAAELSEFNLNADLVVLSACDTGLGQLSGDGVIGLARSLMTAGAPSVIVSLWSVPDDSTATLMVHFYEYLQAGNDKAQALRLAMLDTQKKYPEPGSWAAFTLIGAPD